MNIAWENLKNLPVFTQSNQQLGRICDIEIDSKTHSINKYIIKSSKVIKRLTEENILISPSQVIAIDENKMIVVDNVVQNKVLVKATAI
ncbi:PRC-barrel domain-containing protein [bacterium]|jgi:sporulation protein YlmC with PRC-barrel domain|nr:PRC-barrel domain-containing protein [bacterium]MBT4121919.1 PRC-barrel domain-containing protein [bacterium]MBT4335178.1 PRC-barrel domain-containing protein [bacterium]MBT4495429.1 PRC-barrel domain-containing protein [bacterium]MBT4763654.1 PRC-barrel domain-containing protein [bacterium]